MTAFEALQAARFFGVNVSADGEHLILQAVAGPPACVIELLSRHKPCVVALVRNGTAGWSTEDWHFYFEERAAVTEYDSSLLRADAEAQAYADCIVEWLSRNCGEQGCPELRQAATALASIGIGPKAKFPVDFDKKGGR